MSSDRFVCSSLKTLFGWIDQFEKSGELFGITKDLFFEPQATDLFHMTRYNQILETPLGVAAGPHTQLSQNIIASWLTGARYMELKTVQILDELEVTKPCIDMSDEGYNCEWSQELKLDQSFDEYLNAWIMLHVLKDKFGWDTADRGYIFNLSVGYNLEGILSPTVQRFLDRMNDCSAELQPKIEEIAAFYPRIRDLQIPTQISRNVTISTMHGCPPDEVEKIGRYFIEERKMDTTIKFNPTMLGAEKLREILNEKLGFVTVVPDLAFDHDLKYEAAVKIIRALTKTATEVGVAFNLKLTNTLETSNINQKLPKNEEMVYMSGRALHPISINVAAKLQQEFDGTLDISFSAGADCFNIVDILRCGLKPVTICSDILKPGGYGRISQYLLLIEMALKDAGADSLDDFVIKTSGQKSLVAAKVANLTAYAAEVVDSEYYKKVHYPYESIKTERKLDFFDCAEAPCMSECPAGQEIPRYLDFVAQGDLEKAYQTILATNPFPNVQGKVCDHACQSKCTRINYERPLMIREIKRYVADKFDRHLPKPQEKNGIKVAIIGAGPTGLSCAHYLAMEGFEVEMFEAKGFLGGMAADGIPVFRLDDGSLYKDINAIISLGVKVHLDQQITAEQFKQIQAANDYVYVAVGAQESLPLNIPGIDADGVFDQLTYLSRVRQTQDIPGSKKIIIIGAGNSAMDAARTAKRVVGKAGEVTIVYRRTRREMPCDPEEVRGALEEGIRLVELASPEAVVVKDGKVAGLTVSKMKLGTPDESGRARPIKIGNSESIIEADLIIPAIGQQVVLDFYPEDKLDINQTTYETTLDNVFAGGDAMRGASSLINAIADGQKVAFQIMKKAKKERHGLASPRDERQPDLNILQIKQARRLFGPELPEVAAESRINFDLFMNSLSDDAAVAEASRCLQCDLVCNICTTVCPNRSNMYYNLQEPVTVPLETAVNNNGSVEVVGNSSVTIGQPYQIINIGDYCNECGNCTLFCPSAGDPYKDKPKFHLTEESFACADFGFIYSDNQKMKIKGDSGISLLTESADRFTYEDDQVSVTLNASTLQAEKVSFKDPAIDRFDLAPIAQYVVLYKNVRPHLPVAD